MAPLQRRLPAARNTGVPGIFTSRGMKPHCVFLRRATYTARRKASSMPTRTAASQGGEPRFTDVLKLSFRSLTGSHCNDGSKRVEQAPWDPALPSGVVRLGRRRARARCARGRLARHHGKSPRHACSKKNHPTWPDAT